MFPVPEAIRLLGHVKVEGHAHKKGVKWGAAGFWRPQAPHKSGGKEDLRRRRRRRKIERRWLGVAVCPCSTVCSVGVAVDIANIDAYSEDAGAYKRRDNLVSLIMIGA